MELSWVLLKLFSKSWIITSRLRCLLVCPSVLQRDWSAGISGLRPLYYSTVLQLGLVETSGGLPSLLVGVGDGAVGT
jgi:hypothetical protein